MIKKILIVGYGSIGKRHFTNLSVDSKLKIIICTNRKDLPQTKNVVINNSLIKCLKERPDVAFVTNNTSDHVSVATKIVKTGASLFLEKPVSDSMTGIKELSNIVHRQNLITMVGCNMRFHPCIKKIKTLLSKNSIGKVISVQVESGSYLPDWHPYEDYSLGYAARKELGGGIALTCIHEIDYLRWFFGEVKEVFSITDKFSDLKINVDDLSVMILRFNNNIIGEVHLDYFQRPDFKSCKIKGTKGIIYWNSDENQVRMFDIKKKKWVVMMKIQNYDKNRMYVEEIKYFLQRLKKGQKTFNTIDDGIKTLKIVLAAKKSSKLKKMLMP